MNTEKIFVGREEELKEFMKALERPAGEAVLVVGQAGMGKTMLVNKMARLAEKHPAVKCGWVRYEVTPTDSVDSTMALMMDNAFEAAQVEEGSFDGTKRSLGQWRALLNVVNLGDLVMSLKPDPQRNTREQFLERLQLISKRMPENGRAIFIIDPEKYMMDGSDGAWSLVVKKLPEKIKLVFAQRPEDVLVDSGQFNGLANVVRIPNDRLDVLDEEAIDRLVDERAKKVKLSVGELRKAANRYQRHPYAVAAALDMIEDGAAIEELPSDPTPEGIVKEQRKRAFGKGAEAVRLLEAHAVLEVGVPEDVIEAVSGVDSASRKSLTADKYLGGLLRKEGEGRRIYHAILADYILGQMSVKERREYHKRAVEVYREKLEVAKEGQTRPDALAAMRLAEHVLAAEGKGAFVYAFVNECGEVLMSLGLLDVFIILSERALGIVKKGTKEEAILLGNLGRIYQVRGELDKAKQMFEKTLKIHKQLGSKEGMAKAYGNLGLIYQTRGDFNEAEELHNKSLAIKERLGLKEGMAHSYSNLGVVYRTRGKLDEAEEMHKKSLAIAEEFGQQKVMAIQYGNLGLIYMTRGEINEAEEMHKKSLTIEEKLGRLEGMAEQYCSLGLIYIVRGQLDEAEDMLKKSLAIEEKLGRLEGMANSYGNLGVVYQTRGELDEAEEMFEKNLKIHKQLGSKEGMAKDYGNLGGVYRRRGDDKTAREYWEKVEGLYGKIGMPHMVERVQGWIEGLGDKKKNN
ncbi:MAG: tetratricopeptide repeat protein [Planctomycetota bacterium]|jgi:tetratricopeptide (TPR) repeat protein/energy-coupling factor transporter ATP-binding protein EcfA2